MAVDDVVVNSQTGVDGNSYTTAISNDKLTNDDFLKLLLEQLKMQDPTKPMDSTAMMDSQLKMSTIEANTNMAKAMDQLAASYRTSNLSSAVGLMGKTIENGTIDEEFDVLNSYKVATIEAIDGETYVNANRQIGFYSEIVHNEEAVTYDASGNLYKDGEKMNISVSLGKAGQIELDENGNMFYDEDGDIITSDADVEDFKVALNMPRYDSKQTTILLADITKVF